MRNKDVQLKPEERTRQLWLARLIDQYGYPASRIAVEYPITFGRDSSKRADIVVFDADRPTVPYIIIEVKQGKLRDGKEQLRSYAHGAKTFVDRYKETVNRFSNSSEFFHDIAREVRHGYLCATRNKTYCTPEEKDEGKGPIVTFFVKNRVTEVHYRYTPWVQAYRDGGGVHLFYSVWNDDRFANFSWSGSGSP